MTRRLTTSRPVLLLAALAMSACLALSGCRAWSPSAWNLRGEGYTREPTGLEGFRSKGTSGQAAGVDAKAREIEASLGYQ